MSLIPELGQAMIELMTGSELEWALGTTALVVVTMRLLARDENSSSEDGSSSSGTECADNEEERLMEHWTGQGTLCKSES